MIFAFITLYYPKEKHLNNVERIISQVDKVFLCDNSPYCNEKMFQGLNKTVYCFEKGNKGLSAAFNSILKDDKNGIQDDDFLIFFDQDTVIPEKHVKKLVAAYLRLRKYGINVGCIGPCYYNTSNRRLELPKRKQYIGKNVLNVKSIITTSMLCRFGDLKRVGYWNEDIFLDMADWDLCWRFIQNDYLCCMTRKPVITHSVGIGEKKIGPVSFRVGAPIREYYQLRDCRYLLQKEYVPLLFKIRFILMITLRSFIHLALYENKKERFKYMRRARADFYQGVKGEYKE